MIRNGCGCRQVKVYPGLSVRVGLACKAYANFCLTKVVPIIIVVRDVCGCRQVKVLSWLECVRGSCLQGSRWFCSARTKVLLARPSLSCGSLLLICVGRGSRQVKAWPGLRERLGLVTRLTLAGLPLGTHRVSLFLK